MKKSKKILIVVISLICLLLIGILVYVFFIKNDDKYLYEKQLRYYMWENERYNEYKYTCETNKCESKKIEDNLYFLLDNGKYLYKPLEKEKIRVYFDSYVVYAVIRDKNDQIHSLILLEGDYFNGKKYIYSMKEEKTYLEDDNYKEITFLKYTEYDDNNKESYYINYDLVMAMDQNNNIFVIDYKNNDIVFDSRKLEFNNEEDEEYLQFDMIKIGNDKYYYDIKCPTGYSYVLNSEFKELFAYSSKGQMGQFGEGDQYSIDDNRIYVVNVDNESYSIYEINGKLVKKSKKYDYIYCTDKGYFLIRKVIEGVTYYAVIDYNGKEIFKMEATFAESQSIYYDKENNIIKVHIITGMESGIRYNYNLKTGNLNKESYSEY